MVLNFRVGPSSRSVLARFVQEARIDVIAFTQAHWLVALTAYERFGKGRHPASLDFGDCMSYATASVARKPLLCVGSDFSRTDMVLA